MHASLYRYIHVDNMMSAWPTVILGDPRGSGGSHTGLIDIANGLANHTDSAP